MKIWGMMTSSVPSPIEPLHLLTSQQFWEGYYRAAQCRTYAFSYDSDQMTVIE